MRPPPFWFVWQILFCVWCAAGGHRLAFYVIGSLMAANIGIALGNACAQAYRKTRQR